MLACSCWSLIRADLARTVTKLSAKSNSVRHLLRCSFHHKLRSVDIGELLHSDMDRTRRDKVSRVWRQVATQSSSSQDFEGNSVKIDSENSAVVAGSEKNEIESQVKEVQDGISSHLSTIECENEVRVGDDQEINLRSVKSGDEVKGLQGEPINSSEKDAASIEPISSSAKHSISLEVGSSLIRFIKGKGGATQRKIEEEMGVQIIFPSSKKEESIIIEGDSAESVDRAHKRVQDIIDEAVQSPSLDYSHFVSLPLAIHPQLVDKLVQFQNSILGIHDTDQGDVLTVDSDASTSDEEPDVQHADKATKHAIEIKARDGNEHVRRSVTSIPLASYPPKMSKASALEKTSKVSESGIERSIFIRPKTFHLTVLMLKLWNKDLLRAAAEVLQSISSEVIQALDSRPVSIQLKGLECMKGSFAKARVLYAPVEEIGGEERLLRACQVIIDAFVEAGLVLERDATHKLKLHATVMNVRHRKRKMRTRKFDFFDARSIADQYGSEDWGVYVIREAHLSERFRFDENGYYHCCTSIPFPEDTQLD
ncbi:unnamed protein product [Coffea canephora]|uniref:K Homology domain-containing protein n=1 Tax=Coffea canephora TaxID=49390 RepID=A0A068TNU2_COFCA|nr:unnamed protein product [Coffea canephora]